MLVGLMKDGSRPVLNTFVDLVSTNPEDFEAELTRDVLVGLMLC